MAEVLGRTMHFHAVTLKGRKTVSEWKDIIAGITATIRMDNAGEAATWAYPLQTGAGGNGHTIVQPITESFIALDTWPDHDGAYLVICSCRAFEFAELYPVFARHGLALTGETGHTMRLT